MAKKPTEIIESPPAMDYAEHEATWNGFTSMVKWSVILLAIFVVALYVIVRP